MNGDKLKEIIKAIRERNHTAPVSVAELHMILNAAENAIALAHALELAGNERDEALKELEENGLVLQKLQHERDEAREQIRIASHPRDTSDPDNVFDDELGWLHKDSLIVVNSLRAENVLLLTKIKSLQLAREQLAEKVAEYRVKP